MNPRLQSEKILADLQYDFRDFTIEHFINWVGELKGRRIFSFPLKMPAGLFGAWLSDGEEPNEYIFYRANVPPMYQIHIQLHELAHILLEHPTLRITRKLLAVNDWVTCSASASLTITIIIFIVISPRSVPRARQRWSHLQPLPGRE